MPKRFKIKRLVNSPFRCAAIQRPKAIAAVSSSSATPTFLSFSSVGAICARQDVTCCMGVVPSLSEDLLAELARERMASLESISADLVATVEAAATRTGQTTFCPLKSTVTCTIKVDDELFENVAWSYEDVFGFDPLLGLPVGPVGFMPYAAKLVCD